MKARAKRTHPHIRSYKTRGVEFWRVTFSLNKHQVRKQGFHSFEAAEDYYASARKMIRAGQWSSKSLHEMTKWNLNELYEHYKKVMGHRRAYATQKNGQQFWRDHIGPHVGHYKVREISRRVLAHWVNQLREYPLTDNTIGSAKAEFRNVLKMCVEYELIEEAPQFPKLTKNPKKKEMLSPEEVRVLLDAADRPQYRDMMFVQYSLALRMGELLGLQPQCFDLDAGTVEIKQQFSRDLYFEPNFLDRLTATKNGIVRTLPMSDELIDVVRPYVEGRNPEAPLWISVQLKPIFHAVYNGAIRRAVKASGIQKRISSHCLRASMLDWLVNHSGLSIQTVAYYGRHTAAVLVSRYSQPDMSQIYEVFGRREAPGRLASCKIVASIELEGE